MDKDLAVNDYVRESRELSMTGAVKLPHAAGKVRCNKRDRKMGNTLTFTTLSFTALCIRIAIA